MTEFDCAGEVTLPAITPVNPPPPAPSKSEDVELPDLPPPVATAPYAVFDAGFSLPPSPAPPI
jgi:hypothetical protein